MRFARLAAFGVVTATALAGGAPSAVAKTPPPSINLHVTGQVTAGQAFSAGYADSHIPLGDHVLVQRQIGSVGWKTVAKIKAGTGRVTIPGLQMGKYWVRIALFNKQGKGLKSVKRLVKVFGTTTTAQMCPQNTHGWCESDSYAVGQNIFTGEIRMYDDSTQPGVTFSFPSNTCRSVSWQFATPSQWATSSTVVDTVSLVQTTLDPVTFSLPVNQVATLNAALDGKPFQLIDTAINGEADMMVKGTASCWTASGT